MTLSIAYCMLPHVMHKSKARAWVQELSTWSEDDQAEEVAAWCAARGLKLTLYRRSKKMSLDTFIKSIRSDEIAVLADLAALVPLPRDRTRRPGHHFGIAMTHLFRRTRTVVEVRSNATSDDDKIWLPALEAAMRRVMSGRKALPTRKAREMQQAAVAARRGKSPLARWRGEKERNSSKFRKAQALWKSRAYANAAEAQKALAEEWAEFGTVSRPSLDRLFDGRN